MWGPVLRQLGTRHRVVVPDVPGLGESAPVPRLDADVFADLARIDVPVTLLWGRHDRMVPLGIAESAAARHGWPLAIVDDAAHAPHVEQPDAFVETLTAVTARC